MPKEASHSENGTSVYQQTIVMDNNGKLINRLAFIENGAAAARYVAFDHAKEWLQKNNSKKVVIYSHGGLNSEKASIDRVSVMAPYFLANGIYPIFLTWKTGVMESLSGIISDVVFGEDTKSSSFLGDALKWVKDTIVEKTDRTIELTLGKVGKPLWTQMKQNAHASAKTNGGLNILARHLKDLNDSIDGLEIHLMGHSAGTILNGYLLNLLGTHHLKAASCTLYAAACTVEFANKYYVEAVENDILSTSKLRFHMLDDDVERDDHVIGIYRKSLLYMISRALEDGHKTPILGMEKSWGEDKQWNSAAQSEIKKWLEFVKKHKIKKDTHYFVLENTKVFDGVEHIDASHGSFDNDVALVTDSLELIKGGKLDQKVENLTNF